MLADYLNPYPCLKVYTLGHFAVKAGNSVISDDCKRSQQLWSLFIYIFTYRNMYIQQDAVCEALWSEKECAYPGKALKNLVYRLRLLLPNGNDGESIVNYSQGSYRWNAAIQQWTDADEFEALYEAAGAAQKNDHIPQAMELYQKALTLYKGDYLAEYPYLEWVTPARNHYRRLYLEIISRLTGLLKGQGRHQEVIRICEATLIIEPFEESIHLNSRRNNHR